MRINNNLMAMNTHRQLGINSANGAKSIEKLSSGNRINRAGDDAAGLAISEKMRSQVRGLNQASRNGQDGISLIQTAEGALNESQAILQRMRELAVQSANDTNVTADRSAIQNEIDQLGEEINRIANTTEFNTQSLLKGDGKANLSEANIFVDGKLSSGLTTKTAATQTVTFTTAAAAADTFSVTLNGEKIDISWTASGSNVSTANDGVGYDVTSNSAKIAIAATPDVDTSGNALKNALDKIIEANAELKGNYTVSVGAGGEAVTITASGDFSGDKGFMTAATEVGATVFTGAAANVGTTVYTQASKTIDFDAAITGGSSAATDTNLTNLVGKGFSINGSQVEFYDSTDGPYTGDAIGVAINTALEESVNANKVDKLVKAIADTVGSSVSGSVVTASGDDLIVTASSDFVAEAGNDLEYKDGGVKEDFSATFQIGSNESQTMEVKIGDMRAEALGIEGVNISTSADAQAAITTIDKALGSVSNERAKLGAFQNRLEHTIKNLDTSSENLQASESRIRDVDMAKEMMEFTKNNILQQAAQAMLAQANQAPQGVLQLLR